AGDEGPHAQRLREVERLSQRTPGARDVSGLLGGLGESPQGVSGRLPRPSYLVLQESDRRASSSSPPPLGPRETGSAQAPQTSRERPGSAPCLSRWPIDFRTFAQRRRSHLRQEHVARVCAGQPATLRMIDLVRDLIGARAWSWRQTSGCVQSWLMHISASRGYSGTLELTSRLASISPPRRRCTAKWG